MIKQLKWVSNNFYIFFCFFTFLTARGLNIPLVPLLLATVFLYFPTTFVRTNSNNNKGNVSLLLLGLYILFSVFIYIIKGYPLDIYFNGVFIYCYPVIFFYFASQATLFDRNQFYERTIFALMFTYIIGLYLYFVAPSWYTNWKVNQLTGLFGENTDNFLEGYRILSSFFSHSYFVGYTSFWALSFLLNKIYTSDKVKMLTYLELVITILVLILAQQRVTFVLGLVLILIYTFFEIKNRKHRITYFVVAIVLFALYFIFKHLDELSFLFSRYLTVFDGSILSDGRDEQWRSVYTSFNNIILGEGFNIVGHAARSFNMPSIADGEIFKTLYELGVVGSLLFYGFCARTILRAYKNIKYYSIELPVVIGFIAMQYGADPFGMTNIIILFWFSVGVIWNKRIVTI